MKARNTNKAVYDVKQERDSQGIELINYGNGNRVMMEWGWSQEAIDHQMVRLTMKNSTKGEKMFAIINAEEFMRYLRWA
jgi:hypothetical protein